MSWIFTLLYEGIGFGWWPQMWGSKPPKISQAAAKFLVQKPMHTSFSSAVCCSEANRWAIWTSVSVRPSSAPSWCCCSATTKGHFICNKFWIGTEHREVSLPRWHAANQWYKHLKCWTLHWFPEQNAVLLCSQYCHTVQHSAELQWSTYIHLKW